MQNPESGEVERSRHALPWDVSPIGRIGDLLGMRGSSAHTRPPNQHGFRAASGSYLEAIAVSYSSLYNAMQDQGHAFSNPDAQPCTLSVATVRPGEDGDPGVLGKVVAHIREQYPNAGHAAVERRSLAAINALLSELIRLSRE